MSNIVPMNTNVPAHLAGRIGQPSKISEALSGGIGGGAEYPRISIKGSRFRIVDEGVETVLNSNALDVVVVEANPKLSKSYYAKAWTPDSENTAPDCYSLDGVKPHIDASNPQNDLCASCPHNAWGSSQTPDGKDAKSCADQKRLAVLAADDPSGPLYLLQVTPAALKGLNKYHKELMQHGIAVEVARTRVSFDPQASFPKLKFEFGGFLDEGAQNSVDERIGSDEALIITGQKVIEGVGTTQALGQTVVPMQRPAPVTDQNSTGNPPVQPAPATNTGDAPRGFAAQQPAPVQQAAPVQQQPAPVQQANPEPAAAPSAASGAKLADEIANLINEGTAADDA